MSKEEFRGNASLYFLSSPVSWYSYDEDCERIHETNYVIVSAVNALFSGPETYIFPSDERGNILN